MKTSKSLITEMIILDKKVKELIEETRHVRNEASALREKEKRSKEEGKHLTFLEKYLSSLIYDTQGRQRDLAEKKTEVLNSLLEGK